MLHLKIANIKEHSKEGLIEALNEISSELNADFNGDNGDEYTSDEALKSGFENNLEYYADVYKDCEEEEFLDLMLTRMLEYADYYEIQYFKDENKSIIGIAVAIYDRP